MIESIVAMSPPVPGVVDIEYSCTACDSYQAHPASVQQIAGILNHSDQPSAVLQFGHHFIHCGEPMREFDTEQIHIRADIDSFTTPPRFTEVELQVRTLRCQCGFRMSVPG